VIILSPRTGRPKAESPKSIDIKVRIDDDTNKNLTNYCKKHDLTRAEVIRMGLLKLLAEEK